MAFKLLYLVLLFASAFLTVLASECLTKIPLPCPFNDKECKCFLGPKSDPLTFCAAQCQSLTGGIVYFTESPQGKYTLTESIAITGNVSNLPANYFSAFSRIPSLYLEYDYYIPQPQHWDDSVFDGYNISILQLKAITGVFPPPPALSKLGSSGLTTLSVTDGKDTLLEDYCFQSFITLENLNIDSAVYNISEKAFAGLENSLKSFRFVSIHDAGTEFPLQSLYGIKELAIPSLDAGLKNVEAGAFMKFPNLRDLSVASNDLAGMIDAGVMDDLPPKLAGLELDDIENLCSIPTRILKMGQLEMLRVWGSVKAIMADDFAGVPNLRKLVVSDDPVSTIELGCLAHLSKLEVLDFGNLEMDVFDLSVLAGSASNATVNLAGGPLREIFTVSSLDGCPERAQIQMMLQPMDPKIGSLLDRYPEVKISIDSLFNPIDCDVFAWIAPYVVCTRQIHVKDALFTKCTDGETFQEYVTNAAGQCPSSGQA